MQNKSSAHFGNKVLDYLSRHLVRHDEDLSVLHKIFPAITLTPTRGSGTTASLYTSAYCAYIKVTLTISLLLLL